MKTTYLIQSFVLCMIACSTLTAQKMYWAPVQKQNQDGCSMKQVRDNQMCYHLIYTPETSGILTSYTTGFFVSCTHAGSPVIFNESCSMDSNVRLIEACETEHISLMNSSGNTGRAGKNDVKAGHPVILHQVCFQVPLDEEIELHEDHVTDLTTSITTADGKAITEFPEYAPFVVRRPKVAQPEESSPLTPAGGIESPLHAGVKTRSAGPMEVTISPNPAHDRIVVALSNLPSETTIQCVDKFGKVVLSRQYEGVHGQLELNIAHLAAAVYTLVVESGDEVVSTMFAVMD